MVSSGVRGIWDKPDHREEGPRGLRGAVWGRGAAGHQGDIHGGARMQSWDSSSHCPRDARTGLWTVGLRPGRAADLSAPCP